MKKHWYHIGVILVSLALVLIAVPGYCVDEFDKSDPAGTELVSDIDSLVIANNTALDRIFPYLQGGCALEYLTSATLTVKAGMTVCSNSAGTIRKLRTNTSDVTVTWVNIDTGSENASTTYYVYAVGDADTATFTIKITTSSTSPSGITYFKKLGSFYNNSSSNIEQISDGNAKVLAATGTVANGGTIPLPTGYAESECYWTVSINSMTDWDGGGSYEATFTCSVDSSRLVTIQQTGSQVPDTDSTANYFIIGIRNGT